MGIGDEEVAEGVHRDARGRVEPGGGGRDTICVIRPTACDFVDGDDRDQSVRRCCRRS